MRGAIRRAAILAFLIGAAFGPYAVAQPLRGAVSGPAFTPGPVTATATAAVAAPGSYVVVVTIRAHRAHQFVTLYVPGEPSRELYARRWRATRVSFRMALSATTLRVRAISAAP